MKIKLSSLWISIVSFLFLSHSIDRLSAQGTAFTYQGRLDQNGVPYSGSAEFQATLWNASSGGTALASNSPLQIVVSVTNGLFVLPLNFGANFPGDDRWLQLEVRTSIGAFTSLSPRQPLSPTPYAITAGNLSGSLPATQLSGTIPPTQLPASVVTNNAAGLTLTGNFIGNGANLTGVDAATLGGISSAGFWKTNGNAGANPTNGAFLGTTDNLPLEIKVNGQRALRITSGIDPTYGVSPNLVGGFSGNILSNGAAGGVIGGGGAAAAPNRVGNSFATVVGGFGNAANGFAATAMGNLATASGGASTAMGSSTLASGGASTAMGQNSTASGGASTAMGFRAKANHDGTFVWADSQNVDFASTATDQFLLRTAGGVGINTNNPAGAALAVVGGIRTGINGTVQSRVQFGTATVGTGTNGVNTFTITFPTAFTVAPKIFVMAKGNDNPDTFAISTRAVTAANFKVNIIRTDIASGWGQPLQVDWYAVE